MAMAVKDSPAANSPKSFDRLAIDAFAGVAYVLAALWAVFYLVPWIWWDGLKLESNAISVSLLIVAMVAGAGGLMVLGNRLVGPRARPGLKAGVFLGVLGVVSIAALVSLIGTQLERNGVAAAIGVPVTAGIGLGLLALLAWLYTKPGCDQWLVAIEDQGWFTAEPFKKSQGLRVRRGTLIGLLIMAGCGIYTMLIHQVMATAPENWELPIPYTGRVEVVRSNDTELNPGAKLSAEEVRRDNEELQQNKVRITNPGDATRLQTNQVVAKDEFERIEKELKDQGKLPPTKTEPNPAEVKSYPRVILLPHVLYTLPLLLTLGSFWLAYRVVNVPIFADFLIATEAELNKVSWTTRRRLVQDTIVVLATVFLLTLFLFMVDLLWSTVLSSDTINVLKVPTGDKESRQGEEVPW